jgi:3-oxoacyl-[acyl-carrier protein] reductase
MNDLTGKVIIVTGASKGIGATVALRLAEAGGKVVVNFAHGLDAANETVKRITDKGFTAIAVQADVSKSSDVVALFDEAIREFGQVDVLVNNAGVMITRSIKDTTDEDFDRQFGINVKGTFNTLREAATRLSDNGSVINFSSSVNRVILPAYGTYVASKSAVEQLTRVFAKEVGNRGINVNSVSPGPTNTALFTNGKPQEVIDRLSAQSAFNRIGEPDDIAKVIVFLASDEAKWISAQNIGINGGFA